MDVKQKSLQLLLSKEHKVSDFDLLLKENIQNACKLLQIEEPNIRKLVAELDYGNYESSDSVRWKFICLTSHILLLPEPESDIINVTFLTNVKTAFQFIVSLGLLPNLIPGIGIDIKLRFKNFESFQTEKIDIKEKYYRLRSVTEMMLKCLEIQNLRNYLVENHLNDILAGLLQITGAPLKKPDSSNDKFQMSEQFYLELMEDRKKFQTKLHNLILNTHQPLLFRELMFLNGNKNSPNWLKNTVLQILMERVQVKMGVESLIRALFESESQDTGLSWKHWDILTKLLMTKPNYVNENEYYENICGQLHKLLKKRSYDGQRIPKFENALILCAKYLYENKENLCVANFLTPMIEKLYKFTENSQKTHKVCDIYEEIEQNIFILHSIFVDKKSSDKNIPILIIKPILIIVYELFLVTMHTKMADLNCKLLKILVKYCSECSDHDRTSLYDNFLFGTDIQDILNIKKSHSFRVEQNQIFFEPVKKPVDHFFRLESTVYFLENSKNNAVVSSFFTFLLETFLKMFRQSKKIESSLNLAERKVVIYQLLLKLLENKDVLTNLKNDPSDLLIFAENFLKIICDQSIHRSDDYDSENFQTLFIITMVISNLLKNCEGNRNLKEHSILMNILRKISIETTNNELKLLINEIYNQESNDCKQEKSEYDQAIDELCSNLIPEQAHGLAMLVKLIENKDPETLRRKQYVLNIFQQNLKSEESFLYLRGIQGLAVLADAFPNIILETLTDEYLYPKGATEKDSEVRMKLGEVLVRVTASLGEVAVKYKGLLLNTFLEAAKDPDPLIRASSLSNLGEVCKVLGFRVGTIITEIVYVIHDVISNDLAVEVRRASVSVIRQLFVGLGKDMIAFLKEDILPIYRTLKSIYNDDPDTVTRLQAQLALEELNEIMKCLMAPETNLERNFVVPEV